MGLHAQRIVGRKVKESIQQNYKKKERGFPYFCNVCKLSVNSGASECRKFSLFVKARKGRAAGRLAGAAMRQQKRFGAGVARKSLTQGVCLLKTSYKRCKRCKRCKRYKRYKRAANSGHSVAISDRHVCVINRQII
jgi:hypothetical protein